MKEHVNAVIDWAKNQKVRGCITGSALLGYFEGQDVDIFVYDEKSLNKLLYAMEYNPMFQMLDPLEKWKYDRYMNKNNDSFYKFGLLTIKFTYNTCIDVNVILKKGKTNIFSVLSSFDMDIICKGHDIQTGEFLDLSENLPNKAATFNKWNTAFHGAELWESSRVLRQLGRCFKYHKRGYNTDSVVKKYIEIIDDIQTTENIFNSDKFDEKLKTKKIISEGVRKICLEWLETHSITDAEINTLNELIKQL